MLHAESGAMALPEMPFPIILTEKASEMVKQAMAQENLEGHGLRVGVMGGGCSGLQYLLDFSKDAGPDDFANEQFGVSVFIDPYSAAHLAGTVVDYVDGLHGSGFKFENPNVVRACGCGSSFQT
jgi:iron-sulfur cluster assembly accessory protein